MINREDIPDAMRTFLSTLMPDLLPMYVGDLPAEPDECIAILQTGNANSATYFGGSATVSAPLIVFLIRATAYDAGMRNCVYIRELLKSNVQIDNLGIVPAKNLMYLGKDPQHRHVFRINFKTLIKE